MLVSESLAKIVSDLIALGVNLTAGQREYLKWRTSDEGKRYFSRQEENKFYKALRKGDTSVVDVGIRKRQEIINRLRTNLSCFTALILCIPAVVGCITPVRTIPDVTVDALKSNERTYTITDTKITTDNGPVVFHGQWYLVSTDFMKDHVRNQEDLILSLTRLNKATARVRLLSICFLVTVMLLLGHILDVYILRKNRLFNKEWNMHNYSYQIKREKKT